MKPISLAQYKCVVTIWTAQTTDKKATVAIQGVEYGQEYCRKFWSHSGAHAPWAWNLNCAPLPTIKTPPRSKLSTRQRKWRALTSSKSRACWWWRRWNPTPPGRSISSHQRSTSASTKRSVPLSRQRARWCCACHRSQYCCFRGTRRRISWR